MLLLPAQLGCCLYCLAHTRVNSWLLLLFLLILVSSFLHGGHSLLRLLVIDGRRGHHTALVHAGHNIPILALQ